MPLPDFLIAGAQKAGTSWLARMLDQHPQLYLVPQELHFFNKARNYEKGVACYEAGFDGAGAGRLAGEKTPNYMWTNAPESGTDLPDSHVRIRQVLPEVKLIFVLREPVDRAVSAFNHHRRHGRIPPRRSIDEVLCSDAFEALRRRYGILSMGRYHTQLSAYLALFDRSQVLTLSFEDDIRREPERALEKSCRFLGVDASFTFEGEDEVVNRERWSALSMYVNYLAPPLVRITKRLDRFLPSEGNIYPTDETRRRLHAAYRDENERLRELLEEPPSWCL